MERSELVNLHKYNNVSNEKIFDAFAEAQNNVPIEGKRIFCHIINAHRVWLQRIEMDTEYVLNFKKSLKIWEEYSLIKAQNYNNRNIEKTKNLLEKVDLEIVILYTNSKGTHYKNTLKDILFHIFNHSMYHRGQIAKILNNAGIEPPITDYIFYKR